MSLRGATIVAATFAACAVVAYGSGSIDVVRPPTAPATTSSSASAASGSSAPSRHPSVTVVPAAGLRNTQVVTVTASGFSPNESLQVVQCADKGAKTGPGDCNLVAMFPVTSDESGKLTVRLEVVRGPFGGNQVTCGKLQPCLVSVTQASLSPTEEADAPIEFTAGSGR